MATRTHLRLVAPTLFAMLGSVACGEEDRTYLARLAVGPRPPAPASPLAPGPEGPHDGSPDDGSPGDGSPDDGCANAGCAGGAGGATTGSVGTGLAGAPVEVEPPARDAGSDAGCLESATECIDSVSEATCVAGGFVVAPCAAGSLCQLDRCRVAEWVAQWGATSADVIESLGVDTRGDAFVTGHGTAAQGPERFDTFLRSYDARGGLRWQQQFPASFTFLSVVADGLIVAGSVALPLPGQIGAGGSDVFLRKYEPAGSLLWTQQFGSPWADSAYDVSVDGAGNIFIAGQTEGSWPGQRRSSANAMEGVLLKASAAGEFLWARQFGSRGAGAEYALTNAYAVSAAPDGSVVIAGSCVASLASETSAGGYDAFVQKYDTDGGLLWTRQFGSSLDDDAWAVQVDGQGNVLVAGVTSGQLPEQTQLGGSDAFLRKYDAQGNERWTRQLGSAGDDGAMALDVDTAGNVLLAGWSAPPATSASSMPPEAAATEVPAHGASPIGERDGFVTKLSSEGARSWTRFVGTASSDLLQGVRFGGRGSVIAAGATSGTFPAQQAVTGADALLVRFAE